MRLPGLGDLPALGDIPGVGELLGERTVRLAVTGLARAGKTVFITSIVHNLLSAAANPAVLPFLKARAEDRLVSARIDPDAAIERRHFPYAELVRSLAEEPPRWPPSTTGTSQIRLALRYRPTGLVGMVRPLATLNLDIIDYPGEWLLDLPLVEAEYEAWSRETLALARLPPRAAVARDWLDFIGAHPPAEPASEDTARAAAELYTVYLRRCREELGLSLLQPGRFLSPGEFEGAPVLWFCPLDVEGAAPRPGSLHALMRERFEGYREHVVRGFYRDHFRRFDRQAVLVDVLHALDAGQAAFDDARAALQAVMESFRFGRSSFLSALLGARIDKVVFLATKADHVAPSQYENLRLLLERMMSAASLEVRFKGGEVQTRAVAAVRCTEAGMGSFQGRQVGMVRGIPVGESQPRVLFSGEVPPAPPPPEAWTAQRPDFPRFRPPRIDVDAFRGIPQIGLDEALQSLIGDKLS